MPDFSLAKYAELCAAAVAAGYHSQTHGDWMAGIKGPTPTLLLRHDVDSQPLHALRLGEIEKAQGLRATYFFRTVGGAYNPQAIREIGALGHEVGYHYETLAQAKGDIPQAIALFGKELEKLRAHAPVKSASMHGSPLHPWDNRAIWEHISPADFGLVGEAYRDIDYRQVVYLNDTGRTWHPTRYNVRDKTGVTFPYSPDSTDEVIQLIHSQKIPLLCLSAHPERWQSGAAWHRQRARDVILNLAKSALQKIPSRRNNANSTAGT